MLLSLLGECQRGLFTTCQLVYSTWQEPDFLEGYIIIKMVTIGLVRLLIWLTGLCLLRHWPSSVLLFMPCCRDLQNSILHSIHKLDHDACIFQSFPTHVLANEYLRLLDSHVDNFDCAAKPQDSLHRGPIPTQSLVTRLHGRTQDRVLR